MKLTLACEMLRKRMAGGSKVASGSFREDSGRRRCARCGGERSTVDLLDFNLPPLLASFPSFSAVTPPLSPPLCPLSLSLSLSLPPPPPPPPSSPVPPPLSFRPPGFISFW